MMGETLEFTGLFDLDFSVVAIPTTDAHWGGGEYEEYDPIDAYGQNWTVLEWCFEHNCFISVPYISNGYLESKLLFDGIGDYAVTEYHRQIWGDVPSGALHPINVRNHQLRML